MEQADSYCLLSNTSVTQKSKLPINQTDSSWKSRTIQINESKLRMFLEQLSHIRVVPTQIPAGSGSHILIKHFIVFFSFSRRTPREYFEVSYGRLISHSTRMNMNTSLIRCCIIYTVDTTLLNSKSSIFQCVRTLKTAAAACQGYRSRLYFCLLLEPVSYLHN
jgi:hypothetical protein